MINSKDILSTGTQIVQIAHPVSINIIIDGYDFAVMGIVSNFDSYGTYSFTLTQVNSRDSFSTIPVYLDGYGNIGAYNISSFPIYSRQNNKAIMIFRALSTINITLFSNTYASGYVYCGLSLIGHYIDSNGNPIIEGQYALPPAIAAKL